jgi:hypothetical protein
MKNKLTINGYCDNRGEAYHGTPDRLPVVHLLGDTGGAKHQSISFPMEMAEQICKMITEAAAFARANTGNEYSQSVTWEALNPDILHIGPCEGGWTVEMQDCYYGPFETEEEARDFGMSL